MTLTTSEPMDKTSLNNLVSQDIMEAADTMAAAATSFSSHGYEIFIQARESFKCKLQMLTISPTEAPRPYNGPDRRNSK